MTLRAVFDTNTVVPPCLLVAANQPYDYLACRDKQDEKFLSLMMQANTSFLVTGDADLLVLNDQVTFNMIKPMEFKTYLD